MVALSARNGDILWDTPAAPDASRVNTSGARLLATRCCKGSRIGRFDGFGSYISAYDITTGKQVWRFYTIPAGRAWHETWGNLPMTFRAGGETRIAGTTIRISISPTGAWRSRSHGTSSAAAHAPGQYALCHSTVELDPDTGKLAWHYQHDPPSVRPRRGVRACPR